MEDVIERRLNGTGHIFKPPGCRFYYGQYHDSAGKVQKFSTRTTDEREALKALGKKIGLSEAGQAVGSAYERATLKGLIDDVIRDYEVRELKSLARTKSAAKHLNEYFGELRKVKTLSTPMIDAYALARQKDGASNGTILRELALLKRALSLGKRNGKVANPPSVTSLKAGAPRQGFLTQAEWLKLRDALPADLRDPVAFLYYSGWRVSEMRSLEWSDVDRIGKRIALRPEHSKNGEARVLRPGPELWGTIERAAEHQTPGCPNVFTRNGKAIRYFTHSWLTACKAAGKPGLLVHDLRRSAIRNLVRAGVPETVAMKCSGHKTRSIFDRYNISSEEDVADAMAKVEGWLATQPQKTADVVPLRQSA
jgi:integrase